MVRHVLLASVAILCGGLFLTPAQQLRAQETDQEVTPDVSEKSRELLADALKHLQHSQLDEAIELVEKAIEEHPDNLQAYIVAAQAYAGKGVEMAADDRQAANKPLRRGAELMRLFVEKKEKLSSAEKQILAISVYNEACCHAIDGDTDLALDRLEEAVDHGFDDLQLMKQDTDLDSLHDEERYKKLIAKLQAEKEREPNSSDNEA